jgi:hypothetical protein
LGAKRARHLRAISPGGGRPIGLLVLSLRHGELLHEQESAAATATSGRTCAQGFAAGPIAIASPRDRGVRAAAVREFCVFFSGVIAAPRGVGPPLSAELHVSDLIFQLPRP